MLRSIVEYLKAEYDYKYIIIDCMRILNENAPKDESNRFQQLTILAEWKKKQDEEG